MNGYARAFAAATRLRGRICWNKGELGARAPKAGILGGIYQTLSPLQPYVESFWEISSGSTIHMTEHDENRGISSWQRRKALGKKLWLDQKLELAE